MSLEFKRLNHVDTVQGYRVTYAITPFIRIMKPLMQSDTSLYVQVEDSESGRSGILHVAQER